MGWRTHSRRDSHESRHDRARHRRKSARSERDDHLSLRRRRPIRTCRRDPAKNGLQKRPFHGRRFQSLENSRSADDEIVFNIICEERGRLARSVARLAQHAFASGRYVATSLRLMSLRLCLFACALLQVAQITAVFAADLKDNSLTAESVLPYQYPPFDKIKDEHFVPAIEAGMREQLKEIEPIANNSEKPTFDNTIVALERTGRLLDGAERI